MSSWLSDELRGELFYLTAQQANGVKRIVQAELDGAPLSRLLEGPDKICTSTTYYGSGKRKGWRDNEHFQQALALARRDLRAWIMETSTEDALAVLSQAAVESARDLKQQVTGHLPAVDVLCRELDEAISREMPDQAKVFMLAAALGNVGRPAGLPILERALTTARRLQWDGETYGAIVKAIGKIADAVRLDRQKVDVSVLDRAAEKTASKGTPPAVGVRLDDVLGALPDEFREAVRKELARALSEGGD